MNNNIKPNKKGTDFNVIYDTSKTMISIDAAYKHANIIKAFKEGKDIQVLSTGNKWMDITLPAFVEGFQFRVKPEILFTNEFGEEFTFNKTKELAYYFVYNTLSVLSFNVNKELIIQFFSKSNITRSNPYKSKVNLYTAMAEHCRKNNIK